MNETQVQNIVMEFIEHQVLDGDASDLTPTTPLLEYGLIDSLTLAKLVAELETRCETTLPANRLTPPNLESPQAIARFVTSVLEGGK